MYIRTKILKSISQPLHLRGGLQYQEGLMDEPKRVTAWRGFCQAFRFKGPGIGNQLNFNSKGYWYRSGALLDVSKPEREDILFVGRHFSLSFFMLFPSVVPFRFYSLFVKTLPWI